MRGVSSCRVRVLGEEYEDAGIGSWLAGQNDSQSGRCIFFDALEANARGGINYGEVWCGCDQTANEKKKKSEEPGPREDPVPSGRSRHMYVTSQRRNERRGADQRPFAYSL